MKKGYYAVWRGFETGVYDNWKQTEGQVKGYSGAQYAGGFTTRMEAEAAYKAGYDEWLRTKKDRKKGGPPLF